MFKIRVPLFEMAGEIGSVPESSSVVTETNVSDEGNAPASDEGANHEGVTKQQSFAQRLKESTEKAIAEERSKWEKEISEKYKDYDDVKSVADYFRELNQAPDMMTLKERIEMERLQQRADEQGISPELQKRLEYLEQRDKAAQELERKIQDEDKRRQEQEENQKAYTGFREKLDEFAREKGADSDKLYEYMVENQIGNMEAAYKAMRHDELEAKLADAEKAGMKKFLQAKGNIPTVPSTNQSAQKVVGAPKTMAEARERAMRRLTGE